MNLITLKTMPLTTNRLYGFTRTGMRYLRPEAKQNKAAMGWEARAQHKGPPLEGPIVVTVALWWPTRRNHDIENLKGLFDALTGIVWLDDSQIVELHITKGYDKANARVELTARPVDVAEPQTTKA